MGQAASAGSGDGAQGSLLRQEERDASLFKQNGSNFSVQRLGKVHLYIDILLVSSCVCACISYILRAGHCNTLILYVKLIMLS